MPAFPHSLRTTPRSYTVASFAFRKEHVLLWRIPTNYRYTNEHEWIALDGKIGTVGITDYAQNSLGDIVYVDVPKVGDSVNANASFGSVESVKAVSDLYSP